MLLTCGVPIWFSLMAQSRATCTFRLHRCMASSWSTLAQQTPLRCLVSLPVFTVRVVGGTESVWPWLRAIPACLFTRRFYFGLH